MTGYILQVSIASPVGTVGSTDVTLVSKVSDDSPTAGVIHTREVEVLRRSGYARTLSLFDCRRHNGRARVGCYRPSLRQQSHWPQDVYSIWQTPKDVTYRPNMQKDSFPFIPLFFPSSSSRHALISLHKTGEEGMTSPRNHMVASRRNIIRSRSKEMRDPKKRG